LSFFSRKIDSKRALALAKDRDFIGYAIVKRDKRSGGIDQRVYESVVRRSSHAHNYIKGVQQWDVEVSGRPFRVDGYLYAQQNGVTNGCAHVAAKTAWARLKENGMSFREMTSLLGITPGRTPGEGLTTPEVKEIWVAWGARCFVADSQTASSVPPPI